MRRQHGFALLDLLVAMLIATLLAVWGAGSLVNKVSDASAQASAVWMLSVKNAVHAFIERYAASMAGASDTAALAQQGYVDWAAPSLAELKADGLLPMGFPESGVRGLSAGIQLMRTGACPDTNCRIEALVYSMQALLHKRTQEPDEQLIAQWLMASQGYGGFVSRLRPHSVSGASFEFSNPPVAHLNALPVGTVAMAVTSGQLDRLDFLRVKDRRDPEFQGRATVTGDIETQGSLSAQDYIFIGAQEQQLTPCSQNGAVAREYYGGLLICRGNTWRSAGGGGAGGFAINSLHVCKTSLGVSTANPVTGACSCPAGHRAVMISDSGEHPPPDGRTKGYLCIE